MGRANGSGGDRVAPRQRKPRAGGGDYYQHRARPGFQVRRDCGGGHGRQLRQRLLWLERGAFRERARSGGGGSAVAHGHGLRGASLLSLSLRWQTGPRNRHLAPRRQTVRTGDLPGRIRGRKGAEHGARRRARGGAFHRLSAGGSQRHQRMRGDRGVAIRTRHAERNGERAGLQAAGLLRADALTLRYWLYGHPAAHRGQAGAKCRPRPGTRSENEGLSARSSIPLEHGGFLAGRTVLQDSDRRAESGTSSRPCATTASGWMRCMATC